ncbi:MAG: NADH-quinone oxidoreductase subunit NuoI [Desulfurococcales archaeon]|nr:NADH-quinone oxidoreductase subunit NuoI [Desulfurococcales archaeon]MEB3765718.1 NADH-quinone oxidoreductase subunit NuoI [Desulfurococcales archaeon]
MPAKPVSKQVPSRGGIFSKFKGNIEAIAIGVKFFFNPQRFTLIYPKEYIKLKEGYRGFIVLRKDKCINCGSCARICPAAAMRLIRLPFTDPKTGKTRMKLWPVINYNRCIFCGYCVDVCPTEALYHVPYHDVVYETMDVMDLDLEEFQKEPEWDAEKLGLPVKYVVDEKMGLVKVRIKEEGEKQ